MPNHITNRVTIEGTAEEKKKFFEKYFTTKDESTVFDFDKVIPMPPGLDMECGENVIDKVKNALGISTRIFHREPPNVPEIMQRAKRLLPQASRLATMLPAGLEGGDITFFKQGLDNASRCGYVYWYDWAPDMWGTKWSAYNAATLSDSEFVFDTAWAHPEPVFIELSKQVPELTITVKYADEDTSRNVGTVVYHKGEAIVRNLPIAGSKTAYEMAFEVKPDIKQYYRFDEDTGTYKNVDDGDAEEE